MHQPDTANENGPRSSTSQGREKNKTTRQAASSAATVQRRQHVRHVPGQLPIVRSATAFPPAWGTVTTLVVLDQPCDCGDWHNHKVKGTAPALLPRKARCGSKYELALHPPKATGRGRRAA